MTGEFDDFHGIRLVFFDFGRSRGRVFGCWLRVLVFVVELNATCDLAAPPAEQTHALGIRPEVEHKGLMPAS
jgi:hypothetical protein